MVVDWRRDKDAVRQTKRVLQRMHTLILYVRVVLLVRLNIKDRMLPDSLTLLTDIDEVQWSWRQVVSR